MDSELVRGARVWVGVWDRVRIGLALDLGLELWQGLELELVRLRM